MGARRVVVTGLGAVSAVGLDAGRTWDALVHGRSGVGTITAFDASDWPVQIAAEVRDFDGAARFGRRRAAHLDRVVQLALAATAEAVEASALDTTSAPERVGVVYATGVGGIDTAERGMRALAERGPEWVNPYLIPMMLPNMAAGTIAMEWGLTGFNTSTTTACAASAHAIGLAADVIRAGRADAVVCGGSEAAVTPIAVAGFAAMKALSRRNAEPDRASRPFDAGRDGFVLGEAAATLVLEERESALRRGAPVLAELVGFATSADAHHPVLPREDGAGIVRAMREALAEAGVAPGDVGYVNTHGTSTPVNDRIETVALKQVFGDQVPPASSTKSMTGHTLGAAGALESVVCVEALRHSLLPPTINLDEPDPDCDLDYVPHRARAAEVGVAMTTSMGFGGHNAALVFSRP